MTVQNQINNVLQPRDYFVLDNLVELVFPQTDASIPNVEEPEDDDTTVETEAETTAKGELEPIVSVETRESESHNSTAVPPLPDATLKVGQFVYTAMRNLEKCGYEFSDDEIDRMCSADWTKKTFHTAKPFMKRYISGMTNNKGEDGFVRFRSEPFTFGETQVLVSKEWYDRQRDYFVTWYNSLE